MEQKKSVFFFFEETGNKQKILEKRKYFSGILNELKKKNPQSFL